jgi:hypothetical protein
MTGFPGIATGAVECRGVPLAFPNIRLPSPILFIRSIHVEKFFFPFDHLAVAAPRNGLYFTASWITLAKR